ncbi:Rhodanese-related sulfurtransferase [Robiginitalea myxolifaciens]|uniref:Rhodanese-related sulfurtransferase n=2 Tax=Robiginitalea myxolifaciens TaxID=400055 RepID=A0A1I6G4B1_9FLAO|nr:Rhodanese-related sulfurtransferase [Robiginitalea myxolifaciens]
MRAVKIISPAGIFLAGLLAFSGAAAQDSITNSRYARMLERLLSHDVPEINVPSVASLENPIFLDTRSGEEFAVSHLEGAVWAGYKEFSLERLNHIPKDRPMVVYCSVGYRSEKVTALLQEAGFQNTYNLYGGIFEWVNQGKPVVDRNGPTGRVHGYNWFWGRWLTKGEVVY